MRQCAVAEVFLKFVEVFLEETFSGLRGHKYLVELLKYCHANVRIYKNDVSCCSH